MTSPANGASFERNLTRVPEWERRALDPHYYPDRSSDCHDLIDRLRQQIQKLTAEPDQSDRHGMTKSEYAIYSILKNRNGRIVSKKQMLAAYVEPYEYRRSNLINVHISRIRKKLPRDEVIEVIWGVGFVLKRVVA